MGAAGPAAIDFRLAKLLIHSPPAIPAMKFLAFDIETAKEVPGDDFNWKPHRPLGISCLASMSSDDAEPRVWYSRLPDGTPAPQMSREDVAAFIDDLLQARNAGYTPLTWNGLGFDLDVLAEESGCHAACVDLARGHIDMMFHVVCEKGFPVALANAAAGLKVAGKTAGVTGLDAPGLWKRGEYDRVMQYVAQDVRVTLAVAAESLRSKALAWRTRRGTISRMPLAAGWLTVNDALRLPEPDTSWMTNPLGRDSFTAWMDRTD